MHTIISTAVALEKGFTSSDEPNLKNTHFINIYKYEVSQKFCLVFP